MVAPTRIQPASESQGVVLPGIVERRASLELGARVRQLTEREEDVAAGDVGLGEERRVLQALGEAPPLLYEFLGGAKPAPQRVECAEPLENLEEFRGVADFAAERASGGEDPLDLV